MQIWRHSRQARQTSGLGWLTRLAFSARALAMGNAGYPVQIEFFWRHMGRLSRAKLEQAVEQQHGPFLAKMMSSGFQNPQFLPECLSKGMCLVWIPCFACRIFGTEASGLLRWQSLGGMGRSRCFMVALRSRRHLWL